MIPKEKADELVEKMTDKYYQIPELMEINRKQSIKNALVSVNEILFTLNEISEEDNSTYAYHTAVFYNEVKTELKKL